MRIDVQSDITQHVRFNPEPDVEGVPLEFRLVYRGPLPSQKSGDSPSKHRIRRHLHKQIKAYWSIHPELIERGEDGRQGSWMDMEMSSYQVGDKYFLPLLTERRGLACALDILFLRRDAPGKLISSGGDIDNPLKVLFDGLRVPHDSGEIPPSWIPDEDEKPLYCLLNDDHLITTLTVTTDRLLTPLENEEAVNDVVLVIQVRAIITDFNRAPWGFIAN